MPVSVGIIICLSKTCFIVHKVYSTVLVYDSLFGV